MGMGLAFPPLPRTSRRRAPGSPLSEPISRPTASASRMPVTQNVATSGQIAGGPGLAGPGVGLGRGPKQTADGIVGPDRTGEDDGCLGFGDRRHRIAVADPLRDQEVEEAGPGRMGSPHRRGRVIGSPGGEGGPQGRSVQVGQAHVAQIAERPRGPPAGRRSPPRRVGRRAGWPGDGLAAPRLMSQASTASPREEAVSSLRRGTTPATEVSGWAGHVGCEATGPAGRGRVPLPTGRGAGRRRSGVVGYPARPGAGATLAVRAGPVRRARCGRRSGGRHEEVGDPFDGRVRQHGPQEGQLAGAGLPVVPGHVQDGAVSFGHQPAAVRLRCAVGQVSVLIEDPGQLHDLFCE